MIGSGLTLHSPILEGDYVSSAVMADGEVAFVLIWVNLLIARRV